MTNWLNKINNAKRIVTQLKEKADTRAEKNKLKKIKTKANEIKQLDIRLKELKREEITANKRSEINTLERKLTTSGKILGMLETGAKVAIKEGGRFAKNYNKTRTKTRTTIKKKNTRNKK